MAAVLPPEANGELQHLQVVEDRGDGDDVVGLALQSVEVGAGLDERARRGMLALEGRHHQRRAAMAVAGVEIAAACGELLDRGSVALGGGGMQAGVGGKVALCGRDLRPCVGCRPQQCCCAKEGDEFGNRAAAELHRIDLISIDNPSAAPRPTISERRNKTAKRPPAAASILEVVIG